jgi:vacuolar-type H+-ATPase subunit I/STV1
MSTSPPSAIALHVEAAKRLLRELEQHAETALHALGRDSGAEFFAAVDARDRVLGELDTIVDALTRERMATRDSRARDPETSSLLVEMAQATAAALELHERLTTEARRERDRLAAALRRTTRVDAVAHQYAASRPRARTISITG